MQKLKEEAANRAEERKMLGVEDADDEIEELEKEFTLIKIDVFMWGII